MALLGLLCCCICLGPGGSAAGSPASDGGTPSGAGREPIGCTSRTGRVIRRGPAAGRRVALTFDDGPSRKQTPEILSILERLGVRVTFFEEGRHVRGREALMRRALAAGDEIANHSYHHPHYPGSRELAATDRRIRRATGFRPCLFRPPYGLLDRRVREAASDNGLETILWTFDSGDDHHPSPARIEAHVVSAARPGSIILMHDGGHHPQTIEALPGLIAGLRRRGYRFATVSALLGDHFTYAPSSPGDPGTKDAAARTGLRHGKHPM